MKKIMIACLMLMISVITMAVTAQEPVYRVGVANFQGNLTMSAQLNPILNWISQRAGVSLVMKSGYNFDDMQQHLAQGEYDFYIGFPALQPAIYHHLNYRVIAAAQGQAQSAIVVRQDAPCQALTDLQYHDVVMGDRGIFVAHVLPLSALAQAGVSVNYQTIGNQESLVTEFKLGRHQCFAVNLDVFSKQVDSRLYRVLWQSSRIPSYPLSVRTDKVPAEVITRVQQAFVDINQDPEGQKILAQSNQRAAMQWHGWSIANEQDYQFALMAYQVYNERY